MDTFTSINQIKLKTSDAQELVSIKETLYEECFEDIAADDVYMLSKSTANETWKKIIAPNTRSYFDLPNDNWLITSVQRSLGEWLSYYNCGDREFVPNILRAVFNLKNNQDVLFLVDKDTILQSSWSVFLSYWDDFLCCYDDCPLLISKDENNIAILFTSLGNIRLIEKMRL